MGKRRAETGGKEEENAATRGVGRQRREGQHWALAPVLTLGSFLPNLSPM